MVSIMLWEEVMPQLKPEKYLVVNSREGPLGLPASANKNTGCPVKFEFQLSNK